MAPHASWEELEGGAAGRHVSRMPGVFPSQAQQARARPQQLRYIRGSAYNDGVPPGEQPGRMAKRAAESSEAKRGGPIAAWEPAELELAAHHAPYHARVSAASRQNVAADGLAHRPGGLLPPPPEEVAAREVPLWVAADKKVLRFFCFFREGVQASASASAERNVRVRRCALLFYLEDGTLSIQEARQDNSGLVQGTFLRRHRVPLEGGRAVEVGDLRVGEELRLYGRAFHLYDADPFTRAFLADAGMPLAPACHAPAEAAPTGAAGALPAGAASLEGAMAALLRHKYPQQVTAPPPQQQQQFHKRKEPARVAVAQDKLKFYQNDRKVLRFFCLWDDRRSLFGGKHKYVLHYFLADDTLEIVEAKERNSGKDAHFTRLLHRMRMPKRPAAGQQPGASASLAAMEEQMTVGERDLAIGQSLDVYGRELLLYDCDRFTREYYLAVVGRSPAEMEPFQPGGEERAPAPPALPPHTGFGSEEDTRANCFNLVPRPPRQDFFRRINNQGKQLQFEARFLGQQQGAAVALSAEDRLRRFTLTAFLEDGSLALFEPPVPNSGYQGGKYLSRQRVPKPHAPAPAPAPAQPPATASDTSIRRTHVPRHPGSSPPMAAAPSYYELEDLFIGAVLQIHGREFELVAASEASLQYMEQHGQHFPHADVEGILAKVMGCLGALHRQEVISRFMEHDSNGNGRLSAEELHRLLRECGCDISMHQVLTVARQLSVDHEMLSISKLLAMLGLQEQPTRQH